MRLILASASPRRAELLTAAGFTFEVLAMEVDERLRTGEAPRDYVQRLASAKSAAALERLVAGPEGEPYESPARTRAAREDRQGAVAVLGADTTVVVDGAILGKPVDVADARAMLRRLSGGWHEVLTGISLRLTGCSGVQAAETPRELAQVERTAVFFSPLGDREVDWYVQTGEGLDKAGAYAIQGLASRFVTRIEGSYANVVGLPVAAVHQLLKQLAVTGSFA